jgi:sulfur carrier protein
MSELRRTLSVYVNDRPRALGAPATLLGLMSEMGLAASKGVAAAVNGEVVPRDAWDARGLSERDRVLVIRATQGG